MSYRNPVIPGFYPDPSVCRVGDDYFLVTSSFTCFPGVPIFRSKNLVDWIQIGNVLDRPSQLDLTATRGWSSFGVYAPTIRHHDGRFWMITTTMTSAGAPNYFVTATDPAGPWSDPFPVAIEGIDPDLAWDADGNCWVHFSGVGGIARCRIDDATGEVLDAPAPAWGGTGLQFPEAPHLFEHAGRWYLLIAEGGTERGHAVSIARAPSPVGPWKSCPSNPILSHRSSDRPIQNTGHADFVEATDGSWWTVLLGVRPRGVTPGFHVLGRETFLAPVTWRDGWPVVGELALEIDTSPPGLARAVEWEGRDDFDTPTLHPRWVSLRRPPDANTSLETRPGWLTLSGTDATLDDPEPTFVGRRQQHHRCCARALVETGANGEAGLTAWLDESSHYDVALSGDSVIARARIGPLQSVVGRAPRPPGPVVLVIATTDATNGGPDEVRLAFEDGAGELHALAELDGRYLSTEAASGFTGRMIGMYAVDCDAAFDWFDYQGFA